MNKKIILFPIFILISSQTWAFSYACWGDPDSLKLKESFVLPEARRDDFKDFMITSNKRYGLSYSEVEGWKGKEANPFHSRKMIFQKTDQGILAIDIENSKPNDQFTASVVICAYKGDWKFYWSKVRENIDLFLGKNGLQRLPAPLFQDMASQGQTIAPSPGSALAGTEPAPLPPPVP